MSAPGRAFFDRYPASSRPSSPPQPLGNAGGFSGARLYRYQSAMGPLVARRWPEDGPDPSRLARIHSWLRQAGDLGFVPVPTRTVDGRTVVEWDGGAWEVAPWLGGAADPSRPPPPARTGAMFAGLAAFLSRLSGGRKEGPSPGLGQRAEEIERLMFGEFDAIRARAEKAPADPASPLALL